jgi:AcrR family transcriptional regulator
MAARQPSRRPAAAPTEGAAMGKPARPAGMQSTVDLPTGELSGDLSTGQWPAELSTGQRRGDPAEDGSKRRQILEGARRVFMNYGFDGASMGEIAKAAGVSKGTLYVYFTDKNALFEAIVDEIGSWQNVTPELPPDEEASAVLYRFGSAYMTMLCRPQGGSAVRTVMAIAERMPEVGRRYYGFIATGWTGRLARYLEAQTAAGRLRVEDAELAATQFMLSCQATLFLPFVFQAMPAPSAEHIAKVVHSAVAMFLATYGPDARRP